MAGGTLADMVKVYTEWGWKADAAVLDALAAVAKPADVDAVDTAKPVSLVRYALAKLGARSINTVPVLSSIPGIRAVR